MSSDQKQYAFYIAVERSSKGFIEIVHQAESLEQIKASIAEAKIGKVVEQQAEEKHDKEPEPVTLSAVMRRVVEAIHSQSELVRTGRLIGPAAFMMQADKLLVKPVSEAAEIIESIDGVAVYGLTEETFWRVAPAFERMRRWERGMSALPAAILMSIVATFDSNMADIVRSMLTLKSENFQGGSRTVLVSDVLRAKSLDEIKNKLGSGLITSS